MQAHLADCLFSLVYNNEEELGEAVRSSGVPRAKIFVTTKLSARAKQDIQTAFNASLARLGLDYVDLYLIHSPYLFDTPEELQAGWAALEQIHASGKARSIGVSNFLVEHLETVLKTAKVKPVVNQIEYHPYLQREELVGFMKKHGITVESYGPLTPITKAPGGPVDEVVEELAKKYSVTTGDVLLRWVMDQGHVAITTSKSEERLKGYQKLLPTFTLTKKEIEKIAKEGSKKHYRAFMGKRFAEDDRR
jgi:diketogulonate reductase-like aldo/keto reductase